MTLQNEENRGKILFFLVVCVVIVGLILAYLMYRTGLYETWNNLAYFETGIIICCGMIMLALAGYLLVKLKPKYEVAFFSLVLALGILYMLVITPMSVPDERYHYDEAYRISNYILGDTKNDLVFEDYLHLVSHYNTENGYIRVLEEFGGARPTQIILGSDGRKAPYLLCYLPQIAGVLIGRIIGRNFITLFMLGRFSNLLFYACCVYVAVKTIPRLKVLMGVISVMPMALHQAASFSTDSFINGLSFILIAYAFKMIWSENSIEKRDLVLAIITAVLLAPAKVIYCAMFLLYFLIPVAKFGTMKRKISFLCTIILLTGLFAILFQLPSILDLTESSDSTLNWEGQENYDLVFVMENPMQTVKIFVDSFAFWHMTWLKQAVGSTLSGLSLPVDRHVVSAYIFTILICVFDSHKFDYSINWKIRTVCIIAVLSVVFLAMTSMFLGWTSITRNLIEGVQGRYFIPVLPLLAMPMAINKIRIPDSIMNYVVIFAAGLNVLAIAEVLRLTIHSIIAY